MEIKTAHYMLHAWTAEDIRNEDNPSLNEKQDYADFFKIQDRAINLVSEDGGYEVSQVDLVFTDVDGKTKIETLCEKNARDYVYVLKYDGNYPGFSVLAADMIESDYDSYEDLIVIELFPQMEDSIERCNELVDLAFTTRGPLGPYDCTGKWFCQVWSHQTEKIGDRVYAVYLGYGRDV